MQINIGADELILWLRKNKQKDIKNILYFIRKCIKYIEAKMKNKKNGMLFSFGIVLLICSSCIIWPYHTTFYENLELPGWTDASGSWSLDNEKWLMHGYDHSNPDKIRNEEIMNNYIIDGALCNVSLRAKNETTTYSKDPYGIYFYVWGFENKHISFTIKNIDISIKNGENLSHLFNEDYSNKIFLKSESETNMLCWGYYHTEPIFNFKRKPAIIKVTFEIEEADKIETKVITYELTPEEKWGLFQMID